MAGCAGIAEKSEYFRNFRRERWERVTYLGSQYSLRRMDNFKTFLQGKKTYCTAIVGILYLIGVWAELWPLKAEVLSALGFTGLVFLRSGMKQTIEEILRRSFVLAWLAVLGLGATGCETQNASGRLLASTAITVDSAMQGWGEYVRAGQATAKDEAVVKAAYVKYQACMGAAKAAYEHGAGSGEHGAGNTWEAAARALRVSRQELLNAVDVIVRREKAQKQ